MERESWIKTRLDELGITTQQAAVICDISGATMEIVVSGYPTLPQLAIKIANGLGLTREEAKTIGKALDGKSWGRDGLPPANPVDADPEWYMAIPEKRKTDGTMTIGTYVDTMAVLNRLIEMGKDTDYLTAALGGISLRSINDRREDTRKKYIRALAERLGVPVKKISTVKKPTAMRIIRFEADKEAVEELLNVPRNNRHDLAARMFNGVSARQELNKLIAKIQAGEMLTVDLASRLADALGTEISDIGRRVVKTY